eukprot:SAG31_NODE_32130_length_359_cov_1.465385_1_plen_81_part_10
MGAAQLSLKARATLEWRRRDEAVAALEAVPVGFREEETTKKYKMKKRTLYLAEGLGLSVAGPQTRCVTRPSRSAWNAPRSS